MNDLEFVKEAATRASSLYSDWRKGQATFNMACLFFPEQANKLRGTRVDCFHDDSKIDEFLAALFQE